MPGERKDHFEARTDREVPALTTTASSNPALTRPRAASGEGPVQLDADRSAGRLSSKRTSARLATGGAHTGEDKLKRLPLCSL